MVALASILFLTLFVFGFGAFLLFGSYLLGPHKKQRALKSSDYECGLPKPKVKKTNIPVKYYLTAILFIIFDIEVVFIYPWAISYKDFLQHGLGLYILVAIGIFLVLFLYGLFWEIRSKALDWQ